ncbi:MAG: PKD domain-containing protein [Brumimicrobium sp.]|nr:PKD domain-containing protein [Brumimicrobium sp.]
MKKTLRRILIGSVLFTLSQHTQAQCNVTIETLSDTVPCGASFELIAVGQSYDTLLYENFNNSSLGPGWFTNQTVMYNNPCGAPPDGSPSAWFGNAQTQPRILETVDYDLSCGGELCFMMKYAEQGGTGSCEGPDQANEGVLVQYSTNGGATWTTIFDHVPLNGGYDPVQTTWQEYCHTLPAGALTPSTRFRWYQNSGSGAQYDHWGIDDVRVLGSICSGTYTYFWGNPGVQGDSDTTMTMTQNQEDYIVYYTDGTDTCSATITMYGYIDANIPNDTTICGLTNYDIVSNPTLGSGSYDYIWNTGETSNTISNATTGQYWVEVTDQLYTTCVARDTINFEMFPIPDVNFSASPLCQGATTMFTDESQVPPGYPITAWNWDFDDLGAGSNLQNPSHLFGGVGIYNVTLEVTTGTGCTADTTITIEIEPSPFADFSFSDVCDGESVTFINESLGNISDVEWYFGDNSDTINDNDPTYTYGQPGTYNVTLIVSEANGVCADTLTQVITVFNLPNIQFSATPTQGDPPLPVEFYNESTGAISYEWNFGNGNTSISGNDTLNQVYPNTGEYVVTLTGVSSDGCTNSYSTIIYVDFPDLLFEIPNVFTPNNDNSNDEFLINYFQGQETITEFEIVFLNRWGNVLRTFDNPNFEWDGTTDNGSKIGDGTYFYKLYIKTKKDQEFNKHGFLHLVK